MQLYVSETNSAIQNQADLSRHFCKEDRWPKPHEKMLNVTYYQKNANQNYNEASPQTCHSDIIKHFINKQ